MAAPQACSTKATAGLEAIRLEAVSALTTAAVGALGVSQRGRDLKDRAAAPAPPFSSA